MNEGNETTNLTIRLEELTEQFHVLVNVWIVLAYIAMFIALVSNVLTIYVILSNKIMRTKINIIVANWAGNDAMFLLLLGTFAIPSAQFFHADAKAVTIMLSMNFIFLLNGFLIMLALTSTTVAKKETLSLKMVMGLIYAFSLILFVICVLLCAYNIRVILWQTILSKAYIILLFVLIVKEINGCCKSKKKPLSRDTKIRLSLVRIVTYNYLFVLILTLIGLFLPIAILPFAFFALSLLLNGFYILLFLLHRDNNFKNCFNNVFRKNKEKSYNVDAALKFIDEDSIHEEANGNITKQ